MDGMFSKRDLRKAMKARRREVPAGERSSYSAMLCSRLLDREDVRRTIACKGMFAVYLASPDEIDLYLLVQALWGFGCRVVVPAWRDGTYMLVPWSSDTELVPGPMGILEPSQESPAGRRFADEKEVSVWIVPGLAFSRFGARLGYGGGWYDRFLSKASASSVAIGVAYPFQIVDGIPLESHDRPLADVVSLAELDGWRAVWPAKPGI